MRQPPHGRSDSKTRGHRRYVGARGCRRADARGRLPITVEFGLRSAARHHQSWQRDPLMEEWARETHWRPAYRDGAESRSVCWGRPPVRRSSALAGCLHSWELCPYPQSEVAKVRERPVPPRNHRGLRSRHMDQGEGQRHPHACQASSNQNPSSVCTFTHAVSIRPGVSRGSRLIELVGNFKFSSFILQVVGNFPKNLKKQNKLDPLTKRDALVIAPQKLALSRAVPTPHPRGQGGCSWQVSHPTHSLPRLLPHTRSIRPIPPDPPAQPATCPPQRGRNVPPEARPPGREQKPNSANPAFPIG